MSDSAVLVIVVGFICLIVGRLSAPSRYDSWD